jgi:hypothetical protein
MEMRKIDDCEFVIDGSRARHIASGIEVWLDPNEFGYHHRRVLSSLGRPADGAFEVQVEIDGARLLERHGH